MTPLPLAIRQATVDDAGDIARVGIETWRVTYAGIIADGYLARLSEETWTRRRRAQLERFVREPAAGGVAYVVESPDAGIGGYAMAGPEPSSAGFAAQLHALYLLPDHQRRGLGRRLVAAVAGHLFACGLGSMLVWVAAKNPSRRFYETLGGQPVGAKLVDFDGQWVEEVSYGWADISMLLDG